MPVPPPQLNLLVFRSPDIHRAVEFYRRLGLSFTLHKHGSGPEHYASESSGMVIEISPLGAKSTPTTGTRIGFRVNNVNHTLADLAETGVEVITPPSDSEWGRRAVVKDLDGHVVELLASAVGA